MKYPNLELIEETFKEKVKEKYPEVFDKATTKYHKCYARMFVQNWINTATGFDLEEVCSGQAFTDEYTTIMFLSWWEKDKDFWNPKGDICGVFFGNRLAYIIRNPNKKFELDLKNTLMESQKNAEVYVNDEFREYRDISFS